MINILEEFAQDNIHTHPAYFKRGTEYARLMGERADSYTEIAEKFSEDDLAMIDKLLDVEAKLSIMQESNYFSYGYQLGTLIMIEVFDKMDRLTETEEAPPIEK